MISPQLTIADGTCTDPGFEEGGNLVNLGCVASAAQPVLNIASRAARRVRFRYMMR